MSLELVILFVLFSAAAYLLVGAVIVLAVIGVIHYLFKET